MIGVGEYARIIDGVVYVIGNDRGLFQSVRVDRDEECEHRKTDLTKWTPLPGERVQEAGKEDCVTGMVVQSDGLVSFVAWAGFNEPQRWPNVRLEPALFTDTPVNLLGF